MDNENIITDNNKDKLHDQWVTDDAESLNDAQLAEIREIFSFFDKDCDGSIPLYELGPFLRAIGMNPSEQQITEYSEQFKDRDNNLIELDDCVKLFVEKFDETQETPESLREAFRKWDTDGMGYVSTVDFRRAMANFGEKLTEEQLDELIEEADNGDERINYEDFCKLILGPV